MRPLFHFTAPYGWINDPNGLIFHNNEFHIYYQHNPFGTKWGNMHWGHAVTKDFVSFNDYGDALKPDENGTMFSGSALHDVKNVLNLGKDAIIYFYTAMGDKKGLQCLGYSTDNGYNIVKDCIVLDNICDGNRDPKVFYHKDSDAYIMPLFVSEPNNFAIFRSTNLREWKMTDSFYLDGMRECPDLFKIDDTWVFWSAQGKYILGDFDGYKFTIKTSPIDAYAIPSTPYAAQTISSINDIVTIGWFNNGTNAEDWFGTLTIPHKLSLINTKEGKRISFEQFENFTSNLITKEIIDSINLLNQYKIMPKYQYIIDATSDIELEISNKTFKIPNNIENSSKIIITVDEGIIEIIGNTGTFYLVLPNNKPNENYIKLINGKISSKVEIKEVKI